MFDLIIIGAGPAGLSAAYEAKKHGLDYLVIEKGLIGNTVYNYPVGLTVFSTTNELELEEGGLKPAREKPTREELLSYYVRFALGHDLNIHTEEKVLGVANSSPSYHPSLRPSGTPRQTGDEVVAAASADVVVLSVFTVTTDKSIYKTKAVLFAIGGMDYPRKLNVKGEDLRKVHDHFRETYPWVKKRAVVVGGGNSAGEAALFLAEEGADTTLAIFRSDWENADPKQGCIKYWVKQPLEDKLKKHCLKLFFLGKIIEIRAEEIELEDENGDRCTIPNDVVFVLIGSDADLTMLKKLGVETEQGKYGEVPLYDPETYETNVPGIYVAGHFTHDRHIKEAIAVPRRLMPHLAAKLKKEKTAAGSKK
jgi:thioredoxin reductase (NADPH)